MAILEEPVKGVLTVRSYIGGEWIDSQGEFTDVVNPATCRVIAKVPISTREELYAAVKAAEEAFPDWRRTPPPCTGKMPFQAKGADGGTL